MEVSDRLSFENLLLPETKRENEKLVKAVFPFVKKIDPSNYFICTTSGLVHFNMKNRDLTGYLPSVSKNSISGSEITSVFKDKDGGIWIGTTQGLDNFNIRTKTFKRVSVNKNSEISGGVFEIFDDKAGNIWVTDIFRQSDGNRLSYLNKHNMELVQVKNNPADPNSIPTEFILRPFRDKEGNYWFGTFGAGVFRFAPFQKKFSTLKYKTGIENSLAGNSAWAMAEDLQGRIWVTMHQDGLDCYDPVQNTFTHHGDKLRKFLNWENLVAISLVCDKQNTLWIGTLGAGLVSWDLKTNKMKHYYAGQGSPNPISNNSIAALSLDHHGNILISYSFFGFDILNPKTGAFKNFKNHSDVPANNAVRIVTHDSNDNYWVSFDGAIARLNSKTGKMALYFSKKNKGRGIIADKASCIFEDSKKRIWVGTHGGGLSLFDPKNDEFLYWTEKDGLINNVVYGILEDNSGKLWLSTNNGLSCFDPNSEKFINYYENDGLQGSEFNANSFLKTKKGIMLFGGIHGITRFNPTDIVPDPVVPAVSITGLQIYNKKVEVIPSGKRSLLKDSSSRRLILDGDHLFLPSNISYTNELEIDYSQKIITFEYSALRFDMPERCTFMYKMEGFEKEWNVAGDRRFATYTNLPPGEYFFKVTAANSDGIWNPEPAKIRIVIKPPFYLTWWFISFGIASLILASTSYVMKREKNLKRTKNILEEKVKVRTHELNEKNEELILRNIQIIKQKEEIANQAKRLRYELDTQNQTSEQALLRSQINPHFLFNTLNNIYSLVYQKSANAPEALMKLSDIMRYMLYDTSSDMVLLDKEVQYLRSFIDLHTLRLKNKDFVSFDVVGDPSGKQIAPMLLIAFVENAFKHGNKSVPSPGIQIMLDCMADKIRFSVKNFKNTSAAKDSLGGIGLTNVKRRLELIYHDKYKLEINDLDDKFEVDLIIKEKQNT
jgi:ligand-binding sensor domain-containing protein